MDEFLKDLLKENKNSLAIDEILWKIQKRDFSVKVWLQLELENAKKSDAPPLSLDDILSIVEQTICLLCQTSNSISYHRRYSILSIMCSPLEANIMLKNKLETKTNDEILFGKRFSDHLTESIKSRKSSNEVFLKLDDRKKPFWSSFLFQQHQRKSGEKKPIAMGNWGNPVSRRISSNSKCRAGKRSLINKSLIFKRGSTKAVDFLITGRSHFLSNLQKLTLNQDILSVVKGYAISFIKIRFQWKVPNFPKMNKKQIALVDLELKEIWGRRQ